MYESYWGMNGRPFEQPCSAAAYYPSETHQSSILQLRYAMDHQRHALLVGETGIGKSLLLRRLATHPTDADSIAVQIKHVQLPVDQLASQLAWELVAACRAADLETREPVDATLAASLSTIETAITAASAAEQRVCVLLDDVHLLDGEDRWRLVRALMDMNELEARLTVMLAGQTSVLSSINRRRDVEQRLSVKSLLKPFSLEQTMGYLVHRLAAVGATEEVFADTAIERLHVLASGVPRQINRLADLCLVVGYADEVTCIDAERVDGVAQQLMLPQAA